MIAPARWIAWSALMTGAVVPLCGTGARGQAPDSLASDTAVRRFGGDSVPATGAWLPRLQVGAYIGTIRADSIVPTAPIFQFTDLLTARLPSVDVQSGGGMSGSGARIIIRGGGSIIAGSDPVVYLDGVRIAADPSRAGVTGQPVSFTPGPLQMGRLEDLSPNEIERVDVLTGPAATTQYGLDSWNGVVLVTTRRPNAGAPHWSAYAEDGVLSPPAPRVEDNYMPWGHPVGGGGESYCAIWEQAAHSCVIDSVTHYSPLRDAAATPFTNGSRDRFGLQVGGGVGPGRYFVSGDRQSEMGILQMPASELPDFETQFGHAPLAGQQHPNSLDRTNLRGTLGADLGEYGDISVFGNTMGGVHRTSSDAALAGDVVLASGARNAGWGTGGIARPSITFADEAADRVERYTYGATATLRPVSSVAMHFAAGADRSDSHSEDLEPGFGPCNPPFCQISSETTEHVAGDEYTGDAGVSASLPAGSTWVLRSDAGVQYREQRQIDTARTGLFPTGQPFPDSAASLSEFFPKLDAIQRGAYFEQTVTWDGRVTLTGAVHAQGPHGLLGKSTQGFPRVAASWTPWEHGTDIVRVHAAYGVSADLPIIQSAAVQAERSQFFAAPFGPFLFPRPAGMEYVHEAETGIDAERGRISAGATIYQRTIDDMALPFVFEDPEGFDEEEFLNSGSVRNRGIELTLDVVAVRTPASRWDLTVNAWGNQNRVESLGPEAASEAPFGYLVSPGHALYAISQSKLTYRDANGDGVIEPNEVRLSAPADQGSSVPTRGAGLQNTISLLRGRFRIGALIDYKGGNGLIDPVFGDQLLFGTSRASADPRTPLAEQAQAIAVENANNIAETYSGPVQDASFVRFRELSFTVNASPGIARVLRTTSAAISLVARNLWLWTPYKGTDPEINTDGNADPVYSYTVIPQPRYFVVRVTLGY
jgi:TonB-dependent starch-binding outer membrane protein SusC